MAWCLRRLWAALVLVIAIGAMATPADARKQLIWLYGRNQVAPDCEPPHVFYSSQHVAGRKPCCPAIEGICPGGAACPGGGVCASDGKPCVTGAGADRPNIVLFITDDQGACHFGNAEECRSAKTGTPVPAPKTPNLDLLAGYGTVFPIAHNTASWCFPSLASMMTGRYQKSFTAYNRVTDTKFTMVPSALRGLPGAGSPSDPYNAGNVFGGYCTVRAGKLTGSINESVFDALTATNARRIGRTQCVAGGPGQPPLCGTAAATPYDPFTTFNVSATFNFVDSLLYKKPNSVPAQYAMQHFFVWYAPRLPHQPLRAPLPVKSYLFGTGGLGGLMNLGQWCSGPTCAPVVDAFDESSFGSVADFYGNVWWVDDNVRDLRRFLAAETASHCIGADGRSRFDVGSAAACGLAGGTWSSVTPDLERNTVFMILSDNGWHLPDSKHRFTENGYRTQLLVYDPRTLPTLPSWDPQQETAPAPQLNPALAHSSDLLPTMLGFALGTSGSQACPVGPDGTPCDGKDLGGHLATTPGGPAAPETLRHAMCGHLTRRPTAAERDRFLLTRPGSVGRCTKSSNSACLTSANCGPGEFCVGNRCAADVGSTPCTTSAQCPAGATCLGEKCRMAPACTADSDCTALVGAGYVCGGKAQKWCRNAPNVSCGTSADCPVCPTFGSSPVPCSRLCEARTLKLYVAPGGPYPTQLTDLFIDPDEKGLYGARAPLGVAPYTLISDLSSLSGPYGGAMRRMNCCIDDWWPAIVGQTGTECAGNSCPADLACD